ncbi:LCP family protein [Clostridium sp.]|uniref:LCP family protein n=1 Tax=Clostridium sp. TaxID=1506 RepID=UPI0039F50C89
MAKHERGIKKDIKVKKIILTFIICIVVIFLSLGGYLYLSFRYNSYINDRYGQGNEGNYKEVDGITNILLLGSDARTLDEQARADAILILSIDNIHKNLKLVSIMRDSYVKIPGHGEQKINHAYSIGGVELLTQTIEENFNIRLDNYSIINFNGFQQLIDSIGGLDLDVSSIEMNEMNKFIPEVNPEDPHLVQNPGLQHLDGQQVLSYARIRKVGNGDYDRTKRQREVISAIIDKLKDTNILKYPLVASKLFPYIKTNTDIGEILNYAYTVYKINNFTPEQILIPVPEITESKILKNKGWVLLMDIEQNAKIMNDFIFNNIKYDTKDLDMDSFRMAMEKYNEDVSTNPKDAKDEEPIYNKENAIKEIREEEKSSEKERYKKENIKENIEKNESTIPNNKEEMNSNHSKNENKDDKPKDENNKETENINQDEDSKKDSTEEKEETENKDANINEKEKSESSLNKEDTVDNISDTDIKNKIP